jgi:hypothetical protein
MMAWYFGRGSTVTGATGTLAKDPRATGCWADGRRATKVVYDPVTDTSEEVSYFVECGALTVSDSGLCEDHEQTIFGQERA